MHHTIDIYYLSICDPSLHNQTYVAFFYILSDIYTNGEDHRRRLVINIGGAKIWVTNIGRQKFVSKLEVRTKNFGQIYFQTKNLEKVPFYSSKISDNLFF